LRQYEVTFVDDDETSILQSATLFDFGVSPTYSGQTPTKVLPA
jgi:hypothetical protein